MLPNAPRKVAVRLINTKYSQPASIAAKGPQSRFESHVNMPPSRPPTSSMKTIIKAMVAPLVLLLPVFVS